MFFNLLKLINSFEFSVSISENLTSAGKGKQISGKNSEIAVISCKSRILKFFHNYDLNSSISAD